MGNVCGSFKRTPPESLPLVRRHSDRLDLGEKLPSSVTVSIDVTKVAAAGVIELHRSDTAAGFVISHELVYGTDQQSLMDAFEVNLCKQQQPGEYRLEVRHRTHGRPVNISGQSSLEVKLYVPAGVQAVLSETRLSISTTSIDVTHMFPRLDFFNEEVRVRTASGDIRFGEVVSARVVDIESSSGDVTVETAAASHLVGVRTTSGDLTFGEVRGPTEEVRLCASSGDVVVRRVVSASRLVRVQTTSGKVRVNEYRDARAVNVYTSSGNVRSQVIHALEQVSVKTTSGEVEVAHVAGTAHDVSLCTSSNDITVTRVDAQGRVQINSTSGNVRLDHLEGDVDEASIRTSSGDLRVKHLAVRGRVNVSSTSGKCELENVPNAAEITINSSSGDIRVNSLLAKEVVSLSTTSGDIIVRSLVAAADVRLRSSSGDMCVNGNGIERDQKSFSGLVYSRALSVNTTSGQQEFHSVTLSNDPRLGYSSSDAARTQLQTSSGDIQVHAFRVAVPPSQRWATQVRSTSGDVTFKVSEPLPSFAFELQSTSGDREVRTQREWTSINAPKGCKRGRYSADGSSSSYALPPPPPFPPAVTRDADDHYLPAYTTLDVAQGDDRSSDSKRDYEDGEDKRERRRQDKEERRERKREEKQEKRERKQEEKERKREAREGEHFTVTKVDGDHTISMQSSSGDLSLYF
ncbi:hypothetical protein RI367_007092 [Sorochytrium milnesiophthora]